MRLLIAVRQQEMRAALGFLLSQEADMRVRGRRQQTAEELLACLEVARPDVMLLDCELPGRPDGRFCWPNSTPLTPISKCSFSGPIKVERERIVFGAGAHTFIDKTSHPRQLVTALRVLQLESEYE